MCAGTGGRSRSCDNPPAGERRKRRHGERMRAFLRSARDCQQGPSLVELALHADKQGFPRQHQTVHRTGVMRWFYAGFDRFYGDCLGIQMRADGADCVNRFDSRSGRPPHLFGNEVIDRNMITARFHVEQYISLHGRDFTIRVFERDKAAAKENILLPPHIHRIVAADFKRPVHPEGCGLQKSGHLGVLLLSLPAQQNGRGF